MFSAIHFKGWFGILNKGPHFQVSQFAIYDRRLFQQMQQMIRAETVDLCEHQQALLNSMKLVETGLR